MRPAERVYGALLSAYPEHFRSRFEVGMRDTFLRDLVCAQMRGPRATVGFWIATVAEALWFGLAERLWRTGRQSHEMSPSGGASMTSLLSVDWRDAVRSLRATPVVTTIAVLSLALGIGANTALFSILNSLVLKTLPVHEPSQLVSLKTEWTYPIWEQIRDRQDQLLAGALAWSNDRFNLSEQGQTDFVNGAYASGSAFRVLGVPALRGRMFTEADDIRGGGPGGAVAVISHSFWQRLGGAPELVGRSLTIEHVPFTVVGIMPPGFFGPDVGRACGVVIPLGDEPLIRGRDSLLGGHWTWWLEVIGRLKPGQTIDQANAVLRSVQPQIRAATLPDSGDARAREGYLREALTLVPAATGSSPLRGRYQQPLTIIMVVVGAVLLVACANIANLLLARATARRHELVIRLALGASRLRLARQLLLESLMLAGVGALLGLAIARVGSAVLVGQLAGACSWTRQSIGGC